MGSGITNTDDIIRQLSTGIATIIEQNKRTDKQLDKVDKRLDNVEAEFKSMNIALLKHEKDPNPHTQCMLNSAELKSVDKRLSALENSNLGLCPNSRREQEKIIPQLSKEILDDTKENYLAKGKNKIIMALAAAFVGGMLVVEFGLKIYRFLQAAE